MTSAALCEGIRCFSHRDVLYIPDFNEIAEYLLSVVRPEDVVITQGAGSVNTIGMSLLNRLKEVENSRAA
ncbi:MAG: UDP-N-acetylmuramate--L-alanine ligase [Syntrophus sp. PtaU1.Bin208]|nr:MAG: UDP-N-acetylmuramate--L-alanine ligase [Syntrophus sp. PtaU1.Bin208]